MRKKRILHLITGVESGGGAENMLLQLLPKMQDDFNNRVCAIMGHGEIGKRLEEKGVPVYYLGLRNVLDFGVILRYRKILREFDPDIQVNYLIHADIFGRIFGKLFGVKKVTPYIRNIHRKMPALMFFDKLTIRICDFILTNSEAAKKYYMEKMWVKKEKIKCIPNAIDLSKFHNTNVDRNQKLLELGINPESADILITTIARMEKQKDIPTLIEAFSQIVKKYSKSILLLIGHGKDKPEMIELTRSLKIEGKVVFLEKRGDIPEILKITDIFVLPSLNEGMSNAILEAMASKKLIIASDIPENRELIENDKEGLNFRAGDAQNLVEKLKFAIKNYDNLKKYQEAAFKKVSKKYDLNIIREEYKKFLMNL